MLDACRAVGVAVPDDAAVIGVDNDELVCDLADPPLTSVVADTQRTGYEAARLLDQIMAGRKVAAQPHLFAPLGIVFGHISLSQLRHSGEQGRGVAIAGLIIGYVMTALALVTVVFVVLFAVTLAGVLLAGRLSARGRGGARPGGIGPAAG